MAGAEEWRILGENTAAIKSLEKTLDRFIDTATVDLREIKECQTDFATRIDAIEIIGEQSEKTELARVESEKKYLDRKWAVLLLVISFLPRGIELLIGWVQRHWPAMPSAGSF